MKDSDGQVKHRSDLDELLGMSTTSMDFDVSSVEGEAQRQAYIQVQQVHNDTDPLMWWKQYQQEFPDLSRMITLDHLPRDEQRGHTHTTHTHTLPTHSLTHPYIFTFLCVSHTNTLEVLIHFQHLMTYPRLPTIKPCS